VNVVGLNRRLASESILVNIETSHQARFAFAPDMLAIGHRHDVSPGATGQKQEGGKRNEKRFVHRVDSARSTLKWKSQVFDGVTGGNL
jgi:hypothetical protein